MWWCLRLAMVAVCKLRMCGCAKHRHFYPLATATVQTDTAVLEGVFAEATKPNPVPT